MATDRVTRAELHRSLGHPHPESRDLAELGLGAWTRELLEEDSAGLVNPKSGQAVRWQAGRGWVESP